MTPLTTPHITANSFLTTTRTTTSSSTSSTTTDEPEPVLIYFITGNPGLISYYHAYLSLLSSELSSGTSDDDDDDGSAHDDGGSGSVSNIIPQCIIHGKSMGGFEIIENGQGVSNVDGGTQAQAQAHPGAAPAAAAATNTKLYNLSEQIEHVERNLNDFVDAWRRRAKMERRRKRGGIGAVAQGEEEAEEEEEEEEGGGGGQQRGGVNVILIGHSVGASGQPKTSSSAGKGEGGSGNDGAMDIIGGILLFPTVVDIAKSLSGRKLTRLLYMPYLALLASLLVKLLVFILPESWLRSVVGMVMGSPPGNAIDATVEFLRSRRGVEQAIHMAADEMREITSDTWSDEIWGIVSASPASSSTATSTTASAPAKIPLNLVLYFAQQDHWVADQTRDEIIRARGGTEKGTGSNGPRMQVCEDGVVHGFCIRQSDIMAKKTAAWVRDIIQGRQNGQRFTTTV
ncbi:hypothetical protein EMPG_15646 [Blastomyces silverae]|uniref:Lipid droplet-associated hydrolase n=1 Tax=Blastomyces silverae TaxID=2060906 RepID=A0A0H1BD33_9EURO|nr:hypothetical protein EMPG_15646 [Blastomyces silverae]